MNTIYGDVFDVEVKKIPTNIAYTSLSLDLHIDLPYYESPPGIQLLHCLEFDKKIVGGESIFLDAFWVAEHMRTHHPDEFNVLCEIPSTFQKIHYLRKHPVNILYQKTHFSLNSEKQIVSINWAPSFEGKKTLSEDKVETYYTSYRLFAKLLQNNVVSHGITIKLEQ